MSAIANFPAEIVSIREVGANREELRLQVEGLPEHLSVEVPKGKYKVSSQFELCLQPVKAKKKATKKKAATAK